MAFSAEGMWNDDGEGSGTLSLLEPGLGVGSLKDGGGGTSGGTGLESTPHGVELICATSASRSYSISSSSVREC